MTQDKFKEIMDAAQAAISALIAERDTLLEMNKNQEDTIRLMLLASPKANEVVAAASAALDRYAIPSMQGLCASECEWVTTTELVIEAYDIAEAMIKERNNRTR